jgi:hypothetical protein
MTNFIEEVFKVNYCKVLVTKNLNQILNFIERSWELMIITVISEKKTDTQSISNPAITN